MIALIDFDSHLYHSVYRIVSITEMKQLLTASPELPYKERKRLAFDYIVDIAIDRMGAKLLKILDAIEATGFKIHYHEFYLTMCKNSIRKNISPEYKANRRRNVWVSAIREKLIQDGNTYHHDDEYEADDLLADRARELASQGKEYIIVSIDKDLKQIPGWHFDYYPIYEKDEQGNKVFKQYKGLIYTTEKESIKMLAMQLLMGDSGDRVQGVPGIGKVRAERILQGANEYRQLLYRVTAAYIRNASKFKDGDWQANLYMNYRLIYLGKT